MSTVDTTAATVGPPEVKIRPPRGWSDLGLRELWSARELIYFLTKRELQIRYKQSVFGVSWAVLQPLVMAAVFAVFFGVLVKIETEVSYPVFAVAGLVPWLFTAQAINQASTSLVLDANMLSKVYFPRLAIPLAKSLSLILDLAIALVVVFGVMLVYGVGVSSNVYLVPVFLLMAVLTAFGIGTFFAAVNVKYRDVTLVVPMLVQIWLFVTPVIYPADLVPAQLQAVYAINPMASAIEGFRWALLGTTPPTLGALAVSTAVLLLIFTAAIAYFRRTEQFFADVV